ncbi:MULTISPECIES: hypothetical protein [unclassified Mesorhizobium]|uniref:hypothetical protein n=1 Tax=unclassified Mesorhizobium TaxID=325217 RepID=UPI0033383D63
MTEKILESYSLFPPKLLVEEVFGKKWQKMRPVSAYMRALERDRNWLVAHCRERYAEYEEIYALYERAISDLKERDERTAEFQARLDAIVRLAMLVEPDEEILITS